MGMIRGEVNVKNTKCNMNRTQLRDRNKFQLSRQSKILLQQKLK